MKKSICFILPVYGTNPVGGIKVVYEYANRFYASGYEVGIFYPRVQIDNSSLKSLLRSLYYWLAGFLFRAYKPKKWFSLNKGIKQFLIPPLEKKIKSKKISRYNTICVTSVETAWFIADTVSPQSKIFYFIQDFEVWRNNSEQYVLDSYHLPFTKIVIAPWLLNKIQQVGEDAEIIYNGFDFTSFYIQNPIENRNPLQITILFHNAEHKRTKDCIKALSVVHEKYPLLKVHAFGVPLPPKNLPEWISYSRQPNRKKLNEIYNSSSIYVAASVTEGFGLTVGEAMICGNAICCTDNGGFSCMVSNYETGLLSPVCDVNALAKNIELCISDNDLRIKLAKAGNQVIKSFSWEKAFDKFKSLVEKEV